MSYAGARDRADSLRELHDATDSIIKTLEKYRPRLLTTYQQDGRICSEPLELLFYLINQERRPVLLPAGPIDAYLPSKRPFFAKRSVSCAGLRQRIRPTGPCWRSRTMPIRHGPGCWMS